MKKLFFLTFAAAVLTASCGSKQQQPNHDYADDAISLHKNLPGDSALYGLACDGCTDSVLVFLPYSGGDPDTFDIIDAFQQHRIYGRPHIGDELAVILNPEDHDEALSVVNMEMLKGEWNYMAYPKMRTLDHLTRRMQRRMIERIPDSVRQLMMKPREYSLKLKRDFTASARGEFRLAKNLFDEVKAEYFADKDYFCERSWGMSHDFPIAVEEGSTMVRVGTTIFGPRVY